MTWVRIDELMPEHSKMARAGPLGLALQLAGLCYANRNLTDGFIPWAVAQSLLSWQFVDGEGRRMQIAVTSGMQGDDVSADYVVGLLVDVGAWEEASGGYQIHDYADFQPTKAEVMAMRAQKAAAGQAGGKASAQARAQAQSKRNSSRSSTNDQAKSKQVLKQNPTPA